MATAHEEKQRVAASPADPNAVQVIALMGPPGGGKSSMSRHLTDAYGLVPLSSGELMRSEIERGTELGKKVKSEVESGGLVDDELVLELVVKEIARLSDSAQSSGGSFSGVILDGFPRTLQQAQMLDKADSPIPPIAAMIHVHMKDDILAEWREGRRVCPKCSLKFNLNPVQRDGYQLPASRPKHDEETCDVDGARLERRPDDKPHIAQKRMDEFHKQSLPMEAYYKQQGKLLFVEKTHDTDTLFQRMRPQLEELMRRQQHYNKKHPRPVKSTQADKEKNQGSAGASSAAAGEEHKK